jgi:poly-gamma-glutamate synthesis protein (capsule biosynthesis protein)
VIAWIAEGVRQSRAAGANIVVLAAHVGGNWPLRPSAELRGFARAAIDAGVDVYFGHSAHITQGVEIYKGRAIIHQAGDFIDDYAVDEDLHNDWSFVFKLQLTRRATVQQITLVPVHLHFCHTSLATEPDRTRMMRRMAVLSAELGTTLHKVESQAEGGPVLQWEAAAAPV